VSVDEKQLTRVGTEVLNCWHLQRKGGLCPGGLSTEQFLACRESNLKSAVISLSLSPTLLSFFRSFDSSLPLL
jgi:hypothetical protein